MRRMGRFYSEWLRNHQKTGWWTSAARATGTSILLVTFLQLTMVRVHFRLQQKVLVTLFRAPSATPVVAFLVVRGALVTGKAIVPRVRRLRWGLLLMVNTDASG